MTFSDGGGGALTTRSRSRSGGGGVKSPVNVRAERLGEGEADFVIVKDRQQSLAAPHASSSRKFTSSNKAATDARSGGSEGTGEAATGRPAQATSLSTAPRFLSYLEPTCNSDDIEEDHRSTETQSSSKTISLHDRRPPVTTTRTRTRTTHTHNPSDPDSSNSFLPHIAFSFLVLALLSLSASFLLPPSFLPSLKHKLSFFSPSLASSHQLLELRTFLTLSLQTTTDRLEEQVHELRLEMQEDTRRRHLELQSIREELSKHVNTPRKSEGLLSGIGEMDTPPYNVVAERPDYALGSGGGRVLDHSPVFQPMNAMSWKEKVYTYFNQPHIHPLASIILQPGFNQPGQCLPLAASSNVHVQIALRMPIFPDQVTLTHVSKVTKVHFNIIEPSIIAMCVLFLIVCALHVCRP